MNKHINTLIALVLFISMPLIVSACNKADLQQKTNGNTVGAALDKISLTESEFEYYLIAVNRSHVKGASRENLRNEWTKKQLFAQAASRHGMDDDPILIAKLLNYRRELLSQTFVNKQLEKHFSDDNLMPQYESKKAEFKIKEIRIAHILIPSDTVKDNEAIQAQQRAIKVMAKIRAGELFDQVAKEISSDVLTSKRGGDLGWVPLEIAVKFFGDEIKSTKKGQLIGPIQTNQGWHIVSVLGPTKERIQSFHEVKQQLIEHNRTGFVKTLEIELRERYKLQLVDPAGDPIEDS